VYLIVFPFLEMFSQSIRSSFRASSRLSQLSSQLQRRNMASITTHKLNTGATIPAIGFGTWQDKDAQEQAVAEALKAGYRHIDTVRMPHRVLARFAINIVRYRQEFTAQNQPSAPRSRSLGFLGLNSSLPPNCGTIVTSPKMSNRPSTPL
jgi:hypothetical protein